MQFASKETVPWFQVMAFGFGHMRLSPSEFWSMTPREPDAAITHETGTPHFVETTLRNALEALMDAYPDCGRRETAKNEK